MSERVKRLAPYLITLKSLKPKQRNFLLANCTKEQLKAFEEIAVNLVKNTPQLSAGDLSICKRFRIPLKKLAQPRLPARSKKDLLIQKGGFFAALLPILASVVGGLLAGRS
jgi:hypothetical protein